jgi:hypothetical protein
MSLTHLISGLCLLATSAFCQNDPLPSEFEVASIKPFVQPAAQSAVRTAIGRRGGPGTNDPGQITWTAGKNELADLLIDLPRNSVWRVL